MFRTRRVALATVLTLSLILTLVAAVVPTAPALANTNCGDGVGYPDSRWYEDVSNTDWYFPYVGTVTENRIMSAGGSRTDPWRWWVTYWYFEPDANEQHRWWLTSVNEAFQTSFQCDPYDTGPFTREEAVYDIVVGTGLISEANRMSDWEADSILSQFGDGYRIATSNRHAWAVAVKYGIIQGYTGDECRPYRSPCLKPYVNVNRAVAATMLARAATARVSVNPTDIRAYEGQATVIHAWFSHVSGEKEAGVRVTDEAGNTIAEWKWYQYDGQPFEKWITYVPNVSPTYGGTLTVTAWVVKEWSIYRCWGSWWNCGDEYHQVTYSSIAVLHLIPDHAPSTAILSPTYDQILFTNPPSFQLRATDPDGDAIGRYEIYVWWSGGSRDMTGTVNVSSGQSFWVTLNSTVPTGRYIYVQARTADRWGAWGPYSATVRFRMDQPPDTRITAPRDGEVARLAGPLTVTWTGNDPDSGDRLAQWRVQAASDSDFTNVVADQVGSYPQNGGYAQGSADLDLPSGTYWLRAQSSDSFGYWGPWSPAVRVTVEETAAPQIDALDITDPGTDIAASGRLAVSVHDAPGTPGASGVTRLDLGNVDAQGGFVRLPTALTDSGTQELVANRLAAVEHVANDNRYVFWDPRYPHSWWAGAAFKDRLVQDGWRVVDADALAEMMNQAVQANAAARTIVAFAQDIVPDTVVGASPSMDALIVRFMAAGGTVVWAGGDVPFYYVGHAGGSRTTWGTAGLEQSLGMPSNSAAAWGDATATATPLGTELCLPETIQESRAVPLSWPVVPLMQSSSPHPGWAAWILPMRGRTDWQYVPGPDWTQVGYDDTAWGNAATLVRIGDQPWGGGPPKTETDTVTMDPGLRIDPPGNNRDAWSDPWSPPGGGTIARAYYSADTESGYDYGYLYAYAGGYWQQVRRTTGNWSGWVDLPQGTTAIRIRYTTDYSVLRGPVQVRQAEVQVTRTVPGCPWAVDVGGSSTQDPGLRIDPPGNNRDVWSDPWSPRDGGTITRAYYSASTESGYDYGYLYALVNGNWQQVQRTTGDWSGWIDLPSGTTAIRIRYTTDVSINWGAVQVTSVEVEQEHECPSDAAAMWVWDRPTAASGAPTGTVYFRRSFTVTQGGQAILVARTDDRADVYLDGQRVLQTSDWRKGYTATVTLSAGNHVLAVAATNTGGPAGFAATLLDSIGRVIVHTDSTWKQSGYRSTPPPDMPGQNVITGVKADQGIAFKRYPFVVSDFDDGSPQGWTADYGGALYRVSSGDLMVTNIRPGGCCSGVQADDGGWIGGYDPRQSVTVTVRYMIRGLSQGTAALFHHLNDARGAEANQDIVLSGVPQNQWVTRTFTQQVPATMAGPVSTWWAFGFSGANVGAQILVDWVRIEPGAPPVAWSLAPGDLRIVAARAVDGDGNVSAVRLAGVTLGQAAFGPLTFSPNPAETGTLVTATVSGVSCACTRIVLTFPWGGTLELTRKGDSMVGTFAAPAPPTGELWHVYTVTATAYAGTTVVGTETAPLGVWTTVPPNGGGGNPTPGGGTGPGSGTSQGTNRGMELTR